MRVHPADAHLTTNNFQAHLAKLRQKGTSQQTCKHLVRHAKQFTKFLLGDDRIEVDPLRKLRPPKVTERKHRRRALDPAECTKLMVAARSGESMFDLSGPDREALYLTALHTGYRASELGRLTVANLHFEGGHPHISLAAVNTKNRGEARIPLRDAAVVQLLKGWVTGKSREAKLWPGNWAINRGGGKMMQQDLKTAGIPYEVEGRKADFHALRYTYITNLIKAGEHPAYVQRLARHSDINLTFRVYADLGLEDLYHGELRGAAVTPPTAANGTSRQRSKQTSTEAKRDAGDDDGSETGAKSVALNVALPGVPEWPSVTSDVTPPPCGKAPVLSPRRQKRSPKPQRTTGVDTACRPVSQNVQTERVGFEPTRNLRPCRFSRPVQSATLPPLRTLSSQVVRRAAGKNFPTEA